MILKRFNVERKASDPAKIAALKAEGYKPLVIEAALPPKAEKKPEPKVIPLDKKSKSDLVALAYEAGIDNAKTYTKAELIEILQGDDSDA